MPKRKLSASETAAALTAAAIEDEAPATFDAAHYGALGLNGRFSVSDAIDFFAGGEMGGRGEDGGDEPVSLLASRGSYALDRWVVRIAG